MEHLVSLEVYVTDQGRKPFAEWLNRSEDVKMRAIIKARLNRMRNREKDKRLRTGIADNAEGSGGGGRLSQCGVGGSEPGSLSARLAGCDRGPRRHRKVGRKDGTQSCQPLSYALQTGKSGIEDNPSGARRIGVQHGHQVQLYVIGEQLPYFSMKILPGSHRRKRVLSCP